MAVLKCSRGLQAGLALDRRRTEVLDCVLSGKVARPRRRPQDKAGRKLDPKIRREGWAWAFLSRSFGLRSRRKTVGMIPDDELSRSAEKLGREWREQANKD
jgi:hypothetical protein